MTDMDKGAQAWVHRTARKNFWRVCNWYDLDDLIQDGFMHWWRVVRKYPDVHSKPHLMSLFKMTYTNHIHDLAKYRGRLPEVAITDLSPDPMAASQLESGLWGDLLVDDSDASNFGVLCQQAPEPIRKLLQLVQSEEGRRKLRAEYRRRIGGGRETTNERLQRLTGISEVMVNSLDKPEAIGTYQEVDFERMCREYFAT